MSEYPFVDEWNAKNATIANLNTRIRALQARLSAAEEAYAKLAAKYARLCAEVYVSDRPLTERETQRGIDAIRREEGKK